MHNCMINYSMSGFTCKWIKAVNKCNKFKVLKWRYFCLYVLAPCWSFRNSVI